MDFVENSRFIDMAVNTISIIFAKSTPKRFIDSTSWERSSANERPVVMLVVAERRSPKAALATTMITRYILDDFR
jgi:hypothetical protein